MKHSILLTSLGLCLFSFACGGTGNSATSDSTGDGTSSGPQWYPSVDVGEAGASSVDPEADVASSTGEALTLSGWRLQLPDNSQTTAVNSDHKPWYYTDGSSRVFADPSSGITTGGSQHPRTEMREINTWKASGTNSITVTGKVTKGTSGITVGQVFNDDDSITLAELQFSTSGFGVLYEEKKGGAGSPHKIGGSIGVGQTYTYTMSLTKGQLTVTTSTGGSFKFKPSSAVSGNHFYFKVGNYDQKSTKASSVSSTIHSTVEVSKISLSHS